MSRRRKWIALGPLAAVLFAAAAGASWWLLRPAPTREQITTELEGYERSKDWPRLSERLREMEEDSALRDIVNYHRAILSLNSVPAQDPEPYLIAIGSDSPLFKQAQWLRVEALTRRSHEEHAARERAILETLERAKDKSVLYYRLRAGEGVESGGPSLAELRALYGEFTRQFATTFDFTAMRGPFLPKGQRGSPYFADVGEAEAVVACAAFLLFRVAEEAQRECVGAEKDEAIGRFRLLARNQADHLAFRLRRIRVDPQLVQRFDALAAAPLAAGCPPIRRTR